jgi:hypothetical protein
MPCLFPAIDWELFGSLYSSPISSIEASSFVTAMASLFHLVNTKLQQQSSTASSNGHLHISAFDPQECVSIWSKCQGCCHAITDFSRPLGAQNLGMALFLPHSFYNHSCAPNAFLSCLLAGDSSYGPNRPCAVMARAVCYTSDATTTVPPGESVTLSYIPLSGLCRRERQVRLRDGYHFECHCLTCQEASIPSTAGHALEEAVGGEYAAELTCDEGLETLVPLRELQLNCHQQIASASTMNVEPTTDGTENSDSKDEEDPRTDLIEQSIATLEMAQRGIRNQKLPPCHEISLECHRLLAKAYALLRQDMRREEENDGDKEECHYKLFFQHVAPIMLIFDPSALIIQHTLMLKCLRAKLQDTHKSNEDVRVSGDTIETEYRLHMKAAGELASRALGMDHPFVISLQLDNEDEPIFSNNISSDIKKRKLNP